MTKFSGIAPNASPALADYLLGVTSGNVDDRVTIQNLVNLILKTTLLNNPYKADAYSSTAPALTISVWTKAPINTKNFDTGSNFDTTLNRFVAPVAGFYFVCGQASITIAGSGSGYQQDAIYKNGALLISGSQMPGSGNNNSINRSNMGRLVQLAANDYIEVYALCTEGGRNVDSGADKTFLSVFLHSIS